MIDVDSITIHEGAHKSPARGHCVLEIVSMLAGEPWGDHPECVCPVVGAFARRLNDAYGADDENRTAAFRPLIRKLMGTHGSQALVWRRMFAVADAAVRIFAPLALDAAKQPALATQLRAAPAITDKASALAMRGVAQKVYAAAYAAADAAGSAYASASAASAADDADADYAADAADASASAAAAASAADYAAYADAEAAAYAAKNQARLEALAHKNQARSEALAHGIAVLVQLCEMQDAASDGA
jgi:hypothetical protein